MKNMKLAIISMSVVFFVATIISLVYSLSKGEANAIYLIISDFFLAGLFITTIIYAYKRNHKNDNRIMLGIMWLFPLYFIVSGVYSFIRL